MLKQTDYGPGQVVGDYFEKRISRLFDLVRIDIHKEGNVPDLRAKDESFFVECKASSVRNGGVIRGTQCQRFNQGIDRTKQRIFFAFAYHPIWENMHENYPTSRALRLALTRHFGEFQFYLFPFSIVLAFYDTSHKRFKDTKAVIRKEPYVTLKYPHAKEIFGLDPRRWEKIGLNSQNYQLCQPHERVHILTRQGNLEKELLDSFNGEFI